MIRFPGIYLGTAYHNSMRVFRVIPAFLMLSASIAPAYAGDDSNLYNAWQQLGSSDTPPPAKADSGLPQGASPDTRSAPDALPGVASTDLVPRDYAHAVTGRADMATDNHPSDATKTFGTMAGPTRLEQSYAERAGEALQQVGYDSFGPASAMDKAARPGMPAGAAQDDFVLSAGDRLTVTLRGQKSSSRAYAIDGNGQLLVDDLRPITAAGKTIGEIRRELETETAVIPNEQVFVTLETVRQIDVTIVGHVAKPGRQTLTVFDTAIDALADAGGVDRDGSLRQIMLVRGNRVMSIDLYGLIVYGRARPNIALRDGDRIVVPPVGPTLGIAGGVKRPGIYELRRGERLTLNQALAMAGGLLVPGRTRYLRMALKSDGSEATQDLTASRAPVFGDGDILDVEATKETRTGAVDVTGEASSPGLHALSRAGSLASLLQGENAYGMDIYPLLGLIERQDKALLARQWIAFAPLAVKNHVIDLKLQDNDTVHLFTRAQVAALLADRKDRDDTGAALAVDKTVAPATPLLSTGPITDPAIQAQLRQHAAYVRGAVENPGMWPVADGVTLDALLAAAGGLSLEGRGENVEISSLSMNDGVQAVSGGPRRRQVDLGQEDAASIAIHPGDSVRVNQSQVRPRAESSVVLAGQVNQPGRYDLMPGDHLSDLLKRAGGLTREAYPSGTIFSREAERKAEEQRFRNEARSLQMSLAAALDAKAKANPDNAPNAEQIGAVEQLIGQLNTTEGVGRITVEADPDALAANPDADILLDDGDRIFVPQRPLTVRVSGEVMSPAALKFSKDEEPRDYIAQAGGFGHDADQGRTFVLFPDGSAQPLKVGSWNHKADLIPPGSTIVVPRDPKPFDFLQTAKDVTQVLGNLAITGIFIQDLRDNRN